MFLMRALYARFQYRVILGLFLGYSWVILGFAQARARWLPVLYPERPRAGLQF